ncbi:MAG: L,D-transpeptidase [Chloroflexota bacterium]
MRARIHVAVIAVLVLLGAAFLPMGGTAAAQTGGRWIEVDTSRGVAMAVVNGEVVHSAYVTVGVPGWETPKGTFSIFSRVYNETMDSSTVGIPQGTPGAYYLTGVLYTQYFYGGAALHYNYWSPPAAFGSAAGSHGCVGMTLADSAYFWNFADYGTTVVVY